MDNYRYDKRSVHRRKRRGAQPARLLASVPTPLVFVTLAAVAAFGTQFVVQHSEGAGLDVTHRIGPTPAPIAGAASIIDGDTIEIHGMRIRFNGIDAPESAQLCDDANGIRYRCGAKAAAALDGFLAASWPVRCTFVGWDHYHRFVGNCLRADGASVSAWMVEHGQALDWPRYSHGAYAEQQAKAEAARAGLWVGTFRAPWDWRAKHSQGPSISQSLGIMDRRLVAQSYACQPRRTCSQISSCDEANWYLDNCPWGGKLDRDKDGVPCESLC